MQRVLAVACLVLLWSAPTMFFRAGADSPDTFRGGYDTASAIPAVIVVFAFACCLVEIVRRLSKYGRLLPEGYLSSGFAPYFLFYVACLGATVLYTPSLFLGFYMYFRYATALLVGLLYLTIPERPVAANLRSLFGVLAFYYVVYFGYQLAHLTLINASDVCRPSSDGIVRCQGAGPFQPEFGTGAAFFIFVFLAEWARGSRVKWWHWAVGGLCLVWVLACRTRAVMFAFTFIAIASLHLKNRNYQRALIALIMLVVGAVALSVYFPEQSSEARSFLLREGEGSLETLSNREMKWEAILPYWWENAPVWGLGYSADRFFFANPRLFGHSVDSHNEFIFILITGGIVLAAVFLVVFAKVFVVAFKDVRTTLDQGRASTEGLVAFMLLGYFYLQMPTSSQISHFNLYFNMLESIVINGLLANHYLATVTVHGGRARA